ncbi:hypothetical protein VNO77_19145 [Canavalia gladiata]|uniref:Uncharacterized protein n=1 Tax=Canavalia gladiata TaxID=3824 RepID=A0AAN9LM49_CANGL
MCRPCDLPIVRPEIKGTAERRKCMGPILAFVSKAYTCCMILVALLHDKSIPLLAWGNESNRFHELHILLIIEASWIFNLVPKLEKETGAKIKIHGTKTDTREKDKFKPGTDIQCSYIEMHANISADSF